MPDTPTIEFPCEYPIKVIGRTSADFDARMIAIINKHQEKAFEGQIIAKSSKESNYQSVTFTIQASSQEQLKALFEDLKKDKDVIMVL